MRSESERAGGDGRIPSRQAREPWGVAMVVGLVAGCHSVPPPVVEYSTRILPARNAGAYAAIVPELRGELVLQDATAACSVAVAEGAEEAEAPACECSRSTQSDWEQKCSAWFGGGR